MNRFINKIYLRHKNFWVKDNFLSALAGGLLLLLALLIQGYANDYVDYVASTPIGDLFLDNLPTINVGFFVVEGVLIFALIVAFLFVIYPKYFAFIFDN